MEELGFYILIYCIGWFIGFFSGIALVYHVVSRHAEKQLAENKANRTKVTDLYPRKDS